MLNIPQEVARRLEELESCDPSIQNPNFSVDDLTYHEPDLLPGQFGAREGSWTDDGEIFEFGLVGQISAHGTYLGDYGDMFQRNPGATTFTCNEVGRAKWKLSLAVPHDDTAGGPHRILRHQFESLQAVEEANFEECTAGDKGVLKTQGFVFNGETYWRASAFSENIFLLHDDGTAETEDFASYDKEGIIARLPIEKRKAIRVQPVEYFTSTAEVVPRNRVDNLFRPGTWVEVSCKLRVWASPARDRQNQPQRSPARSYQIVFDAVQHLAEGRLKEGPVKTPPRKPTVKRKFKPIGDHVRVAQNGRSYNATLVAVNVATMQATVRYGNNQTAQVPVSYLRPIAR
ncbi:hypothetical protein AURDEDRAFT_170874 [Auricularia subglabra TFB-10046 SS5]|nr:hypothetical protein AURDEDRAFT_170874 [Auricularia subglabra TFB-10046 SS5]